MKAERPYPQIAITPKGEARPDRRPPLGVRGGGHRQLPAAPEDGGLVDVVSRRGSWLGTGFYNSRSLIRVRLLSRNANDRFDRRLLGAAGAVRLGLPQDRHGPGGADLLPGHLRRGGPLPRA